MAVPVIDQVRDSIRTITQYHNGDTFEVRILSGGIVKAAGYFQRENSLEAAQEILRHGAAGNTYIVLNPADPELIHRVCNKLRKYQKETTSDQNIQRRVWLLIDVDPKRPSGMSAADEEKQRAREVIDAVREYLAELGWSDPLFADSGNGYHLLYHIELPNDEQSKALIESCLKALAAKFNTEHAEIDQAVYNASRISKVYGTIARKGANTEKRPHRRSRILSSPAELRAIPRELLETLAAQCPKVQRPALRKTADTLSGDYTGPEFDILSWCRQHGVTILKEEDSSNGGKKLHVDCPNKSQHTTQDGLKDSTILVRPDGAIGFKCQHAHCTGIGWREFRQRYEPGRYDRSKTTSEMEHFTIAPDEVQGEVQFSTFADTEKIVGSVMWAWPGWLPVAFLTMIVGMSGEGKSMALLALLKTFITGCNWPDHTAYTGETGAALWLETESAQGLNVDRMKKWGIPLEKIYNPFLDTLKNARLDKPEHWAAINEIARRPEVKIVVLDSLRGAHGGDENSSETFTIVNALADLAKNIMKPVIALHHLRKASKDEQGDISLDRIRVFRPA